MKNNTKNKIIYFILSKILFVHNKINVFYNFSARYKLDYEISLRANRLNENFDMLPQKGKIFPTVLDIWKESINSHPKISNKDKEKCIFIFNSIDLNFKREVNEAKYQEINSILSCYEFYQNEWTKKILKLRKEEAGEIKNEGFATVDGKKINLPSDIFIS